MHQVTDEILSLENGIGCCLLLVDSDQSLVNGISLTKENM